MAFLTVEYHKSRLHNVYDRQRNDETSRYKAYSDWEIFSVLFIVLKAEYQDSRSHGRGEDKTLLVLKDCDAPKNGKHDQCQVAGYSRESIEVNQKTENSITPESFEVLREERKRTLLGLKLVKRMKAVMKLEAEPGIVLKEIDKPKIKLGEVLVEVKTAAICGSDLHYYRWDATAIKIGAIVPKILGHEFSGRVVEVGEGVKRIEVGDRVASDSHLYCGKCYQCRMGRTHVCQNMRVFGVHTFEGAFAEYALIPEEPLYVLPDNISHEGGALLDPFGVAMHAVEQAHLTPGDVVTVLGYGTIGLFIQQI